MYILRTCVCENFKRPVKCCQSQIETFKHHLIHFNAGSVMWLLEIVKRATEKISSINRSRQFFC